MNHEDEVKQLWKCWFFHAWTKWKREEINMVGEGGGYSISHQSRYCIRCNKKKVIAVT